MKRNILATALAAAYASPALGRAMAPGMAEFTARESRAYKANSDLSAKQYIIVAQTAAQTCDQATDPTSSLVLGVLQNNPKANEAAAVAFRGMTKVQATTGISWGDFVTTNASGRATKVRSGDMAIGRAFEATATEGDLIGVELMEPVRWFGVP